MDQRRMRRSIGYSLSTHWPEYLIEFWAFGTFMLMVSMLITLFESPRSPLITALPNPSIRLILLALTVGATLTLLIQTPWGQRSGAHMNPAITLAFARLSKVHLWDAFFYIVAQLSGGILGVLIVIFVAGPLFTEPPVHYAVTVPGPTGKLIAFVAETVISFVLMSTILLFINTPRVARFTAFAVGLLVAVLIISEAPLSGASMNPARTLASAVPGMLWTHLWVYLTGPTLGMLLAAELYRTFRGNSKSGCAKILHPVDIRCIHCGYLCN